MASVHFIDFSSLLENGSPCPPRGKFVQLRHEVAGEYILFAPQVLCTFHAQIVELFCRQQTPPWEFSLNAKRDCGVLSENEATIVGGGLYEDYTDRKRLNLSGTSLAFGDYDIWGLEEKLLSIPRFSGYKVFC